MQDASDVFIDWGPEPPATYGEDRVAVMVRDPECLAFYWDTSSPEDSHVARVICLTDGVHFDLDLPRSPGVWYTPAESNKTYRVDLLRRAAEGGLETVAVSEEATLPVRHSWQAEQKPEEIAHSERRSIARATPCARAGMVRRGPGLDAHRSAGAAP